MDLGQWAIQLASAAPPLPIPLGPRAFSPSVSLSTNMATAPVGLTRKLVFLSLLVLCPFKWTGRGIPVAEYMAMALLRKERSQKGAEARSARAPQGGRSRCSEGPEQGEGCEGQLGRSKANTNTNMKQKVLRGV